MKYLKFFAIFLMLSLALTSIVHADYDTLVTEYDTYGTTLTTLETDMDSAITNADYDDLESLYYDLYNEMIDTLLPIKYNTIEQLNTEEISQEEYDELFTSFETYYEDSMTLLDETASTLSTEVSEAYYTYLYNIMFTEISYENMLVDYEITLNYDDEEDVELMNDRYEVYLGGLSAAMTSLDDEILNVDASFSSGDIDTDQYNVLEDLYDTLIASMETSEEEISANLVDTSTNNAPQFSSATDNYVMYPEETFSEEFLATDGDLDDITFTITQTCDTCTASTFDADTHLTQEGTSSIANHEQAIITWTPTTGDQGTHTFTLTASDGTDSTDFTFTVTVYVDSDGDGISDSYDICENGDDTVDSDDDGTPDDCDLCEGSDDTVDTDGDGIPDGCDVCEAGDDATDTDGDGIADSCDNCPSTANANQEDSDGDGIGDLCDSCASDADGDGVCDESDICSAGDDNVDTDADGTPDACDLCENYDDAIDTDADGTPDMCDDEVYYTISPEADATDLAIDSTIIITYIEQLYTDMQVDLTTYDELVSQIGTAPTLTAADGTTVDFTATFDGTTLTITPNENLAYETVYTVAINYNNMVQDNDINAVEDLSYSFTTAANEAPVATVTAQTALINEEFTYDIVLTDNEDISITSTSISCTSDCSSTSFDLTNGITYDESTKTISLTWTPTEDDYGVQTLSINVSDSLGLETQIDLEITVKYASDHELTLREFEEQFEEYDDDFDDFEDDLGDAQRHDDEDDIEDAQDDLNDLLDDLEDMLDDLGSLEEDIKDARDDDEITEDEEDDMLDRVDDLVDDAEDIVDEIKALLGIEDDTSNDNTDNSGDNGSGDTTTTTTDNTDNTETVDSTEDSDNNQGTIYQQINSWQDLKGLVIMLAGVVIVFATLIFLVALMATKPPKKKAKSKQ